MQGHHTHHTDHVHSHDAEHAHAHAHHGDAKEKAKAKGNANGSHAGHSHGPMNYDRVFAIGISLNVTYALVEAGAGWYLNSLALIADAGHNLSDVLGLVLAWFAVWLSRRQPSARHSYGLGRSSILAALANAVLLFVALGAIAWEASTRFASPHPVAAAPVIAIASVGIVVNALTAWLFMRGSATDLNVRGAYLHMVADAAVSAGVVVSAIVMGQTGWLWLDPVTSLAIAAVIAWGTWRLLRSSVRLSLDAVPEHIDAKSIARYITTDPLVAELHDLHIWALSTEAVALTAHVVCPAGHPGDIWLARLCDDLHEKFQIDHATIQVEISDAMHKNKAVECGISF
jgi:cobalt-zinc-cadmium efflux system protein